MNSQFNFIDVQNKIHHEVSKNDKVHNSFIQI